MKMADIANIDIQYLHGVGPKRAELLARELDVHNFRDLLYYFPFRYMDRSTVHRIADLSGDMPYIQLRGRFIVFTTHGEGAKQRLHALFSDGSGNIGVVWFNRVKYIKDHYNTTTTYKLFGKPSVFNGHYSMTHPEIDVFKPETAPKGLVGVYYITEKLRNRSITSRTIQQLEANLLQSEAVRNIGETLTRQIMAKRKLMPLGKALHAIHEPVNMAELQQAQYRLKYEELFFLQLNILKNIKGTHSQLPGLTFAHVGEAFNRFYHEVLPFPLTGAQMRVLREIRRDVGSGKQMNRLLQGDVGSGKTIVAFMAALLAVDNGYQACIMAPTEILATQHHESISEMAAKIGLRAELLTGSTRKKQRDNIQAALQTGEVQILIGTHALIEDTVKFGNLGLAIIDEQHRFGVAQRAKLWQKNATPPHVLVMTATPIPRTLAMTVYGDLDVSVIDELPPGRKPVNTVMRYENDRQSVYRFIGDELRKGRQAYIVYPLIEENQKMEQLKALEAGYEQVCDTFHSYRVAMVHGRMKPAEKDYQMQLFASGEASILVATTVIEVGVNVPNASVMVIENAERFGLSQLHQLRGRVGRGADQSYCILMTKHNITSDTRHRLTVMTQTSDGFVVAEEDLRQRGPGDMEGTQQSGIAFSLKIANLATDGPVLQEAREDAQAILSADPNLQSPDGRRLEAQMRRIFNNEINWGRIS